MAISRRNILRNLGALGLTRGLPMLAASSLLGCKSKASPFLRVLFEGPWVFSHDNSGNLIATAPMDATHTCMCGAWTANGPVFPTDGSYPALFLNQGARWTGTLSQPQTTAPVFDTVVGDAFRKAKAVYLNDSSFTVTPIATDIQITLPIPDAAFVGGRLNDGSLSDKSNQKLDMMPQVATVLKYLRPAAAPQQLTLNTAGQTGPIQVVETEDLIFRMRYNPCSPTHTSNPDVDHVIKAFNEMQTRISNGKSNPGMTLSLNSVNYDRDSRPDLVNDSELGLGFAFPPLPCAPESAAQGNSEMPMNQTLANCAGGGIGVGP